MEYQRTALKQAARRAMRETKSSPRLVTLLFSAMIVIIPQLVERVLSEVSGLSDLSTEFIWLVQNQTNPENILPYLLWSFPPGRIWTSILVGCVLAILLRFLWLRLMNVGYYQYCLSLMRGRNPGAGEIFSGFRKAGAVLLTTLLCLGIELLWLLPFVAAEVVVLVALALLFSSVPAVMVFLMMVSYVGMMVGFTWVVLRYAMVDFLIMDQDLTGMAAVRESKRMMQGNVGKLFVLELSFIGWYLLRFGILLAAVLVGYLMLVPVIVSNGSNVDALIAALGGIVLVVLAALVGLIVLDVFLTPYITGTYANFYDWLRGAKISGSDGSGVSSDWSASSGSYTWSDTAGSGSGTGIGGSGAGGSGTGGSGAGGSGLDSGTGWGSGGWGDSGGNPPDQETPAPKDPRDDPWE